MFSFEDLLALEDILTCGLGVAVAGAYLLARGVLATPNATARRSRLDDASTAVAAAQDRVDALIGLAALGVGFALQTLGYVLSSRARGSHTRRRSDLCCARLRRHGRGAGTGALSANSVTLGRRRALGAARLQTPRQRGLIGPGDPGVSVCRRGK